MYPRIHLELAADPLGSSEYTLGTTALAERNMMEYWLDDMIRENGSARSTTTLGTRQELSAVAGSRSIMNLTAENKHSDNCSNLSSTILTSPKGLLFPQVNFCATFYKTGKTRKNNLSAMN